MRSFDGERLEWLVNHPTIRPTCGGAGYLPIAAILEDRDNHFFASEHGGLLFHWQAPDSYEVHIFALPEGRGREVFRLADDGMAYITGEGARYLWARIPGGHRHTAILLHREGFSHRGEKTFDLGAGPTLYQLYDWRKPCPQQQP